MVFNRLAITIHQFDELGILDLFDCSLVGLSRILQVVKSFVLIVSFTVSISN